MTKKHKSHEKCLTCHGITRADFPGVSATLWLYVAGYRHDQHSTHGLRQEFLMLNHPSHHTENPSLSLGRLALMRFEHRTEKLFETAITISPPQPCGRCISV